MKLQLMLLTSLLTLVLSFGTQAAGFNAAKTFDKKCSSCHWIGEDDIGPNLVGITKRRMTKNKKADWKWITAFIQNSGKVIKSGDKQAVALYNKFKKRAMPPQKLSADEIKKLVTYIEAEGVKLAKKAKKAKK